VAPPYRCRVATLCSPAATARPTAAGSAPVVVTGMARAGTSWVGRLLLASGQLTYVNEPLNPDHPPGRSPGVLAAPVPVERHYQYIAASNEAGWLAPFADTLALRYQVAAELRQNRSPYDLARMARYAGSFLAGRLLGRRALLDDPYALLASGWLADRFGCRVVVVVRDPAAMLASWKRLGWTTDLGELLGQPDLMADWLEPYRAELEAVAAAPGDLPGRVGMLWRMLHLVAAEHERRHAGVRVVRYEDLATDPQAAFAELYGWLGLAFGEQARRAVTRATTGSARRRAHHWSLSRGGLSKTGYRPMDSRANLTAWRRLLDPGEVERVRAVTAEVAGRWYPQRPAERSDPGGRST
jgi:Sulfotransferase domain